MFIYALIFSRSIPVHPDDVRQIARGLSLPFIYNDSLPDSPTGIYAGEIQVHILTDAKGGMNEAANAAIRELNSDYGEADFVYHMGLRDPQNYFPDVRPPNPGRWKNQQVLNAFYTIFRAEAWPVIVKCGLQNMASAREELYSGPAIETLPLSESERARLREALP